MNGSYLEAHWKTVVETIQDGVMIVDRQGIILSVNRAFEDMTGYARGEIIGQPCTTINCSYCEIARGSGLDDWCILFRTGRLDNHRCTLVSKSGEIVHVLKNARLLYDDQGAVIGSVETVTDISMLVESQRQVEFFRKELRSEDRFHGLLGNSPAMRRVFDLISSAAQSEAPVVILGESGTGKELAAEALHRSGRRREGPFVKINCAALSEPLLESELFGHVKGAFTGAYRDRKGRFEAAQGGDIFLDEIGDIPPATQVKLLRVLEEKVIERVGDNTPIPVDVRILSATNRNLEELVRRGRLREDFYFRINVIPIRMPPLRERPEDIPLLADFFLRRICMKNEKPLPGVARKALDRLMAYPWPGNVRELKSAFEYAVIRCLGHEIQPEHLPEHIAEPPRSPAADTPTLPLRHEEMKKHHLLEALRRTGGNRAEAARLLGVSRVTVWNWMKRYGIRAGRPEAS